MITWINSITIQRKFVAGTSGMSSSFSNKKHLEQAPVAPVPDKWNWEVSFRWSREVPPETKAFFPAAYKDQFGDGLMQGTMVRECESFTEALGCMLELQQLAAINPPAMNNRRYI